jgi:glycosyltransferase involved in cell wall biosynthesis
MELAPQRAEFWVLVADSLLKLNRLQDAIPFYAGARKCKNSNDNTKQVGLIFTMSDAYGPYPTNNLIRCLVHIGDLDEAEKEAKEAVAKWNGDESKALLVEVQRIKGAISQFKTAKDCPDIVFTCPGGLYEWDSDLMETKGFGGSEQACIYMARHLHKLSGRPVKVFNIRQDAKLCKDGVDYIPFGKANAYFSENKPFLHIAWRHTFKITDAPTFVWSHDLFTPGGENVQNYNKYLCLSEFHKQYVSSMFGVPEDKILVTSNGIDSDKFKHCSYDKLIDPRPVKNPFKVVFPNSPDRGLEKVIKILELVREQMETFHVELYVFYGFDNMRKMGLNAQADQFEAMCKDKPWIHHMGNVDHATLLKHYEDAALWLYPTDFLETSCITAMECISKGVYPIVRKWGALPWTLEQADKDGMCDIVGFPCSTEMQHQLWADHVKQAIIEKRWTKVKVDPKMYSWENVARSWLEILPKS